jgi:hypothetical protein
MAGRRKPRAVQAREKARARTAERRAREQRLEDLATGWFTAEDEIAEIEAGARRRIEAYAVRVRAESEKDIGRLREGMTQIVAQMLALERVRSVAGRLGIAESAVRAFRTVEGPASEREEAAAAS